MGHVATIIIAIAVIVLALAVINVKDRVTALENAAPAALSATR